jgi:hypothetical protein
MAKFEQGQTLRAVRDTESAYGWKFREGEQVVVTNPGMTGRPSGHPNHTLGVSTAAEAVVTPDSSAWVVDPADFESVSATGGPFDPSKVKAGDTVTLLVTPVEKAKKPFTVTGEVYGAPGALMVGGLWVMNDKIATLTDHQPAPEPESPVPPGFYAVHQDETPGAEWVGFVDNDGDFYGMEDGFLRAASGGDFTVDNPLTVFDPAWARSVLKTFEVRPGYVEAYTDVLADQLGLK